MQVSISNKISVTFVLLAQLLMLGTNELLAATAPAQAIQQLSQGNAIDLIVEYDDTLIEKTAKGMRNKIFNHTDDEAILRYKADKYLGLKGKVDQSLIRSDIKHLKEYQHLPMSLKRFSTREGLDALLATAGVKAVYLNEKMHFGLAESLPLINQPSVAAVGTGNSAYLGTGATVAVIDSGLDISNSAFSPCTGVNTPSTCPIVASNSFATSPATDHSHGNNVSAIVLGVAPGSKIAALNVFDSSSGALASDIISAINWSISNRTSLNIVAINMSLGGSTKYTSTCSSDWSTTPIANAKNAGISVVVASGNSTFTNGLTSPACAPAAISVGAVYDSNAGSLTWATSPSCTDSTTSADKVTCFSNSASYLTMLAPGALITAAGVTYGGTSQAAPHVTGAVAVLRAAFPNETLVQTQSRLTSTGVPVIDTRNSITKPRLNLVAAARPANDTFLNRTSLSGTSGSASGNTLLGTKETGEPNHANNSGGSSIWWAWTAPSSGQVTLYSTGSSFDTLLAVYTGTSVNALSKKAANDNNGNLNTSNLVFQAVAGTQYQFAVDGANNSEGAVALNWSLNTSAQANLSSSISGPTSISLGSTSSYTLNVSNAGPQSASNVQVTLIIPVGASFVSAPSTCSLSSSIVSCSVDTLTSGATQSFIIELTWNSITASTSISSSVSSDVPDSTASNNDSILAIALNTNQNDADVPTLPEWGMLLMATILMLLSLRSRRLI
ncbi:S8 family serine peptidase [Methylotenera sp.]|uniref:S8 family serine peptidase n=1 Tax=Methylotenera sp. TaxID=2051956 RepID=UPI0024876A4E|nr:S8 family serine peptidase [Methylotenera sp.]MDI1361807.1 S8 family serine peptidase [Methylotenera sp.]